ncbi:MAG: arsenate-mycothiol transferase ArsC [Pseudonocardia sp.]
MGRHRAVEDGVFRLLFVCTGNICRSPFAEILTRHLLVGRLGGRRAASFDVRSAGVQAVVGAPMHPDSRAALARWGLHGPASGGFVARLLEPAMVGESDLVLGASPRHRSAAVECNPTGLGVAFGVREFARLAARVDQRLLPAEPVDRAHALVDLVRHGRGLAPPAPPEADRVPDPMGRPAAAHLEAAALLTGAVRVIVDVIAPPRPGPAA